MKVYRYWASAELPAQDSKGKQLRLKKWAGSNENAAEAQIAAERAVQAVKNRVTQAELPDGRYLYGVRDIPEEFIREIGPNSAITRNGMGCLILNTAEAFFADVDIPDPNFFARLAGASRQKREEVALARLRQFMEAHPSAGARIYRTRAGLRYLFTHAPLAVNDETLGWLSELNSDKLYTTLCRQQECFRARLTPKPWRIMKERQPNRYPRDTDKAKSDFESWRGNYESRSGQFAVCKLVGIAGRDAIHRALSALVKEHDRATLSDSALPLA